MSNKSKGLNFEREIVSIFKEKGYGAVRTAGSRSQFDVIIWKETPQNKKICFVVFVQCKVKKI